MNNDNRLRLSEAKNLFRQALQRQNDRAAGFKMPDNMEQRVMGSLQTLSNSPIKGENQRLATVPPAPEATAEEGKANSLPREGWGGSWRSRGVWGLIAASIALLIVLHYNTTDQRPHARTIISVLACGRFMLRQLLRRGLQRRPNANNLRKITFR